MIRGSLFFAQRRVSARPWTFAAVALALAAAGTVIGWGSVRAAEAQEQNVRARMEELPPGERSFRVLYFTLPFEADRRSGSVGATVRSFADVSATTHRIRIWHSHEANSQGTRLVVPGDVRGDVRLRSGRLPHRCRGRICEAVVVAGNTPLGVHVRLGRNAWAVVVGRGKLTPGAAPPSELGERALILDGISKPIAALTAPRGSTVVTTAVLSPARVHAYALADLRARFRSAIVRLERGDDLLRANAPLGVLADLQSRGNVARKRLFLVSGESAALILAFSVFIAAIRRREMEAVDDQLTTFGATRAQVALAQALEYIGPGVAGAALALGATWVIGRVVAAHRHLPTAFARGALPWTTVVVILATVLFGAALLVASFRLRRSRFGVGPFELAALTALGVLAWQVATTGALDPAEVGRSGAAPVILLLPGLTFVVAGVVLLRAVPPAIRLGERLTRRIPLAQLAFVTAARVSRQGAAATTFLAVALGSSLFSISYVATLDRQARDAARFAIGARWRVLGPAATGAKAIRLDGAIRVRQGNDIPVRVLALPAGRIPDVLGWRANFSALSPSEIARRLRPTRVRLTGLPLDAEATTLRVLARSQTDFARVIVLHFLLPRQRFAQLTLGVVWRRWRLLSAPLAPQMRGAQLIAVEYRPTKTPISFKYDPEGTVDLGAIEQRTTRGWVPLPSLGSWTATTLPTGASGLVYMTSFAQAPVRRGLRFEINGTFQPLIHPKAGLPTPLPGFSTGALPALVSKPIDAQAVDGLVTLAVAGKAFPLRTIGSARLFPTIVHDPSHFVVIDYDRLFAALNADQPGLVTPNEAWTFGSTRPTEKSLSAARLEHRLRNDPLAAGTRGVLVVTALVAAVLALLGLMVAVRSTVVAERPLLAEYEALGVEPASLRRTAQLRLLVLSTLGIAAGVAGAFLAVRLIAAFVAVTGTAGAPEPPIVPVAAWAAGGMILGILLISATVAAATVASRAIRGTVAERLRT